MVLLCEPHPWLGRSHRAVAGADVHQLAVDLVAVVHTVLLVVAPQLGVDAEAVVAAEVSRLVGVKV